jgi:hypothetical protein
MTGRNKHFAIAIAAALIGCLSATPAMGQVAGIANTVKSELIAIGAPAVGLGVIWLGILVMNNKGTLMALLVFLIGCAIVLAGGFW